jgi:mannan endo-1,6-alpha-mannosidase
MRISGRQLRSLGLSSCLLLNHIPFASAIQVDAQNAGSLKQAAKTAAQGLMSFYTGDQPGGTPGLLPEPYYWWEAGAMFMTLIEYWSLTGDAQFNDKITTAIQFQVGPEVNFEPPNQTTSEGNDDQVFWAFAALSAAELNFPNPPADQPQWLALAQAVFNRQAARWDAAYCGGGLRWQFNSLNKGYDYKNTISNGGFFQLGARLARYTGNDTYASWAENTLKWIMTTPVIQGDQQTGYKVADGVDVGDPCDNVHDAYFSYNYGTFIAGCAYLYDYSNGDQKWLDYLNGFLKGADLFFPEQYGGGIMSEIQCEQSDTCNVDQASFKAYLTRWMSVAALLVPDVKDQILERLATSAVAAGGQCSGGDDGTTCGQRWYESVYDGSVGVGEQMSATSIFANALISQIGPLAGNGNSNGNGGPVAPLTAATGGNSKGDPSAGSQPTVVLDPALTRPITTGDKAGAGILTTLLLGATCYLAYFVVLAKESTPVKPF